MVLRSNPTVDRYVRGLGVFDIQSIDVNNSSISLCIPFTKIKCKKLNQCIKNACDLFKNEHPKSNHYYFEISLTVDCSDSKTNVALLITVIDDILEEMEIYSIPLNNGDILNRQTKNLFKEMILKELDKVLSF